MKKLYSSPELVEFGTVAELTAAIGSSTDTDLSDFPSQFPASTGSFNVCYNPWRPDSECPEPTP